MELKWAQHALAILEAGALPADDGGQRPDDDCDEKIVSLSRQLSESLEQVLRNEARLNNALREKDAVISDLRSEAFSREIHNEERERPAQEAARQDGRGEPASAARERDIRAADYGSGRGVRQAQRTSDGEGRRGRLAEEGHHFDLRSEERGEESEAAGQRAEGGQEAVHGADRQAGGRAEGRGAAARGGGRLRGGTVRQRKFSSAEVFRGSFNSKAC